MKLTTGILLLGIQQIICHSKSERQILKLENPLQASIPADHILLNNDSNTAFVFTQNTSNAFSDTINYSYASAYRQYLKMLSGEDSLDFKKAVFLCENTYLKGALNYLDFSTHFQKTADQLRQFIKDRGLEHYRTAAHYAIFTYMF